MPFKPFAHLARVSFKGLAHNYAPSVVVAGQSSYTTTTNTLGQIHTYPINKPFAKTAHLSNVVSGASNSGSGAGAKAGYATQSTGSDGGLAQYYAAWQHAQQTGDESDWKQHQQLRRIGWKSQVEGTAARQVQRVDSARAAELLRPSALLTANRAYSENTARDIQAEDYLTEAEALAKVDEAIAKEIQDVKQSRAVDHEVVSTANSDAHESAQSSAGDVLFDSDGSIKSSDLRPSTQLTSPVIDETDYLSQRIVQLGDKQQYADIPVLFETMLRDGLTPTVEAYNQILTSAIRLSGRSYQVWPRALEVYSDMTRRAVEPNPDTYGILIDFLAGRGIAVQWIQKSLAARQLRFGQPDGSFALRSTALLNELYAGDNSVIFATKLYHVARAKSVDFSLPALVYNALLEACIKAERIEDVRTILADMELFGHQVELRLFASLIDTYALVKDTSAAQKCYEQYRDLAIIRASNDALDMQVYASLIKAYYVCELEATGKHFYNKVQQSFIGASDEQALTDSLTSAYVSKCLVPLHLENNRFGMALDAVKAQDAAPVVRERAILEICIAAADANNAEEAQRALSALPATKSNSSAAIAVAALHLRQGQLADAKMLMSSNVSVTTVDFATMYTSALLGAGEIDEAFAAARRMFGQVRSSVTDANSRNAVMDDIDEAIVHFGQLLAQQLTLLTSETSISLLRMMIENGGLVSPVAQHAIASLGPDCVHQLGSQDIALALHVQAGMMAQPSDASDAAHRARFAHLLETVLNRGIAMDPSTIHIVSEVMPMLQGARPDLEQKWAKLLQPPVQVPASPTVFSPVSPAVSSPRLGLGLTDTYDPYAHTCDFRASKAIEDLVESTTGRLENHLSDSLSRFRNVRRAGRHLHYRAYAKLITAAGKTKQNNLMHEILGMAQADVPLMAQYTSVKAGWESIYDAMVSAALTVGDRQMAAKYHQVLLDMGAAPSANTFGIYITTLEGTFDEATEAVKIFQRALSEGVEPSVFLYNAVIGKLGKARRIDDCLFYFGDMQAKGIRPSSVTYGTLVNALCRTSEERFAEEMFDEMEAAPNYRPRAAPYNSIIQYFLNTKRDRSKVLAYYERMKSKNIKPTSHTYKLMIEAHASLDPVNLAAAEGVLAEMRAAGVSAESVHYGTLIHAKGCVMHDMVGARATFDNVLANRLARPTDNLYQNLLESMVANHQVAQTDDVLADMSSRGVAMTPYIANTLIHGWATENDTDKAKTIYDSLGQAKREPSTYEAMTRAFLSAGRKEGAEAVVRECLRKGYPSAVADKVVGLLGA